MRTVKFRDVPVGGRFKTKAFGVLFSIIYTKVEPYTRGRFEGVNTHFTANNGTLCRMYHWPDEDVELIED